MSRPDTKRAVALHLRTRAAVLQAGDEKAKEHALDLIQQAEEIEQSIKEQ